jgi:hypothetical protein
MAKPPPLKTWAALSRQFNNSNTESPTGYRRSPTGKEAMGLVVGGLYGGAGVRALINSKNEIGVALKNAFVGDNAALGSIFEDEAVIIPDPHIPLRLKDVDFFKKADSNSGKETDLKAILTYGGAFTSLRLRTTDINGVRPSGGKGVDIEIDYTLIDPVNHVIHLVELKKGLGAQKKGDAIQLVRAGEVLKYHYKKIHSERVPKFHYYFVAGDAIDPVDVVFFSDGVPGLNFKVLTAEGYASLIGMSFERLRKIMLIRPGEQKKYAKTLFALEQLMAGNGGNTVHYIPNLMQKMTAEQKSQVPNWMSFSSAVGNRVARLKQLDDIGPLIFKKRDLSKKLRSPGLTPTVESRLFSEWLGCVQALSKNPVVREEKRIKYNEIIKRTAGVTIIPPNLTLSEKLQLRAEQLGSKRYITHGVPATMVRSGNWYTAGQRIAELKESLNKIMKGQSNGASTRNKLAPFKRWVERFKGAPINATARSSKTYLQLAKMANNYAQVLSTGVSSANTYENNISKANNTTSLLTIAAAISKNGKLTKERKSALAKLVGIRNSMLTAQNLAAARQQAGLPARQSPPRRVNNGGAGPAPRRNNGANGSAARRQASPPKPKVAANNIQRRLNLALEIASMSSKNKDAALKKLGVTPANLRAMNARQKVNAYISKSLAPR